MAFREDVVAHVDDMSDGEMKQVTVGETEVLLARVEGQYHALHAHCTHYGAPLADGVLSGDRIVCPWHHACFRAGRGDHVQPPGLDSLTKYDLYIENDQVWVKVPEMPAPTRQPSLCGRSEGDERTFVVLGGGAAGMHAVEAIRQTGYGGRLIMISKETYRPYDRPSLSKSYLSGDIEEADGLQWRDEDFYDVHDIELLHEDVQTLDASARTLVFASGDRLAYDRLLMCTGSVPRTLKVDGASLEGIAQLRTLEDSIALREAAQEAGRIAIVGAGFIGMEAAASLRKLTGAEVTIIAQHETPFAHALGEEVGRLVRDVHEDNGVTFRAGREVASFAGNGKVDAVFLDDGERLPVDLVLVGIGVRPQTDYLKGIETRPDGGLSVDEHMQVSDGLYAAGDIAAFPFWRTGERVRIEHWRLAGQLGRVAGLHMGGRDEAYREIPFFWTVHFDLNLRYVGYASSWDRIAIDGEVGEKRFIAYYVKDDIVQAACGAGRDTDMAAIHELMRQDRLPAVDDLVRGDVDLQREVKKHAR